MVRQLWELIISILAFFTSLFCSFHNLQLNWLVQSHFFHQINLQLQQAAAFSENTLINYILPAQCQKAAHSWKSHIFWWRARTREWMLDLHLSKIWLQLNNNAALCLLNVWISNTFIHNKWGGRPVWCLQLGAGAKKKWIHAGFTVG